MIRNNTKSSHVKKKYLKIGSRTGGDVARKTKRVRGGERGGGGEEEYRDR